MSLLSTPAARTAVADPGAVAALLLTSCSSGLSASTTCSDFLEMSEQTQKPGVETLAATTHGSAFTGPMGLANLMYDCQESPHMTLGALMGVT